MENNNEIWKDVPKYEGVYQCSNLGNVKRIGKLENLSKVHPYNSRLRVQLCLNGRIISHRICVLVALTFLDYEEKRYSFEIKSKNGNIWDDRLVNLELVPR